MDRKSIIVVVLCVLLMLLWQGVLVPKYFTEKPKFSPNTNAPSATVQAAITNSGTTNGVQPVQTSTSSSAAVHLNFPTNTAEQLIVITNENARYTFTSRGGGLKEIELVKYPETITRKVKGQSLTNNFATLNTHAHMSLLTVLGGEGLIGDGVFTLSANINGIRAEKILANGLRVIKEFQPSTNYLVFTSVRIENTGSNSFSVPDQEWVIGTATPMGGDDDGSAVGIMWYDGSKSHDTPAMWFENKTLGCFPGTPRSEYRDGSTNIVWATAHNQFFAMVAMPDSPAQQIVSRTIEIPRPATGKYSSTKNPARNGLETALIYPAFTIDAGKSFERKITLFVGPKEYKTLAKIAGKFNNGVDHVMGFGFFGFFSKALLLAMNWLNHVLMIPYGWAIIAITVILKILFWPLTAHSTRSAQKMAAFGPQLAALKEKYKDDPAKFSQKQLEFMRENKINPVSGCLPMLVQLPVFFGLFTMLRTAIELRGASFFWATDLSKSDTIFTIPGLDLPLNPLPLLYIATAIWQTHTTPMSPGMDPAQQKLMRWMPLMFLVFLYNFSSGLALYMTVNNLLTILQTKMTKKPVVPGVIAPVTASALTPASKKKK